MAVQVRFRLYAELNRFAPVDAERGSFIREFVEMPTLAQALARIGVPAETVEIALVQGVSAALETTIEDGSRVSLYPVFESIDVSGELKLRQDPLRKTAFVLDVHLGKLARLLRLSGFDSLYDPKADKADLIQTALREGRILLSRSSTLVHRPELSRSILVESAVPEEQLQEVLVRLDLFERICPFSRCTICNSLVQIENREALSEEEAPIRDQNLKQFYRCSGCRRVYWEGTHFQRMKQGLAHVLSAAAQGQTRCRAQGMNTKYRPQ